MGRRFVAPEYPAMGEFFDIIALLYECDIARTNAFAKRHSMLYVHDGYVCLRVSHIEGGVVMAQAFDLYSGYDTKQEILDLHAVVDDRVRVNKKSHNDEWVEWPVVF